MSNVNIKRAVDNIRANTSPYTPVVELVVNAIQAIHETERDDGKVWVRLIRSEQDELDGGLPEIIGFEVEDNGIGFTEKHRNSFDTLYTDLKINEGGKGFGRLICLKYFNDLRINSVYREGAVFRERIFRLGKGVDFIVDEKIKEVSRRTTGTIVSLDHLKKPGAFEKKAATIARSLVERLLPYFITEGYQCPEIVVAESGDTKGICLNDFVTNELSSVVREISVEKNTFSLGGKEGRETFYVRSFKFYSPKNQRSRISLVAHKREVSGSTLQSYIPEFEDEFYDVERTDGQVQGRNYIIKAYVFGEYLDTNVSLERGGFEFPAERDLLYPIGQKEIEIEAAAIARDAAGSDIVLRQEKKKARVQSYVDEEAPWHKDTLARLDLSGVPYNASNEDIEIRLQREKLTQEVEIKRDVTRILAANRLEDIEEDVAEIVKSVSGASRNDLIHYIALRRKILDIFGKSLEVDESGAYASEGIVHDIIFPRKGNTEKIRFDGHNLWILDERLNFTNYVSSDSRLSPENAGRTDLIAYNRRVLFRGDNEASNPVTIFEFKKPQRDDFTNPSSKEDPVQQIVRYVNDIRDGRYKTPEGRKILVAENTPFYGYVVCDLTQKVDDWLEREKNFTPMPDRLGWFQWISNIKLYVEVISWDKVLRDAKMRNQIFFRKLGI